MNINNMSTVALKSTAVVTLAALTACTCTLTWKFSSIPNQVKKTLGNINSFTQKAESTVDRINHLSYEIDDLLRTLEAQGLSDIVKNCADITNETKDTAQHICDKLRYIFSEKGADSLLKKLNDPTFASVIDVLNKLPKVLSVIDNQIGGGRSIDEMKKKLEELQKKYNVELSEEKKEQVAQRAAALKESKMMGILDTLGAVSFAWIISSKSSGESMPENEEEMLKDAFSASELEKNPIAKAFVDRSLSQN